MLRALLIAVPLLSAEAARARVGAAALELSQDARAAALGSGFVALADNAGAAHVNPAGLAALTRPELSAFYSPYLLDFRLSALHLAYPAAAPGSLGLSYFSFASGGFQGRDGQGNATGEFSAEDRVISLSWARTASPGDSSKTRASSVGVTAKLFQSRLADVEAQTCAVDLGLLHRMDTMPLSLGATVRNIGPELRYISQKEALPSRAELGAAWTIEKLRASFMAGLGRGLKEGELRLGLGVEAALVDSFLVRGNYLSALSGSVPAGMGGLGFGFGLRIKDYQLDGSINPLGELGLVSRFSVTVRFGDPGRFREIRRSHPEGQRPKNTRVFRESPRAAKNEDAFGSAAFTQ